LKKILSLLLTLTSIISISITANAYGRVPGNPPPQRPPHNRFHSGNRMKAQRVLTETKKHLFRAKRIAHAQRKNLEKAFYLQADARRHYKQLRYDQAIRLSFRARKIAQYIIEKAKRKNPPPPLHDRKSSLHISLKL
jgi:hypothetical protein